MTARPSKPFPPLFSFPYNFFDVDAVMVAQQRISIAAKSFTEKYFLFMMP